MDFLGITAVKNNIAAVCKAINRNPAEIAIVAATKNRPPELIDGMFRHGITIAGENRAQEFRDKHPLVTAPVEWHFIGRLQSNKCKYLAGKVSLVHSIDSPAVLETLDVESRKRGVITNYLIEVNSGEEQKGGISAGGAVNFANAATRLKNVALKGIMAMLPLTDNQEKLKNLCLQIKAVYDIIKGEFDSVEYLSMGMSADYLTAIRYGSNMVRLGTAIFN